MTSRLGRLPIIIADVEARSDHVRNLALKHAPFWDVIFLSDDYLRLKSWVHHLGDNFSHIYLGKELANSADRLKAPYLDWLSELGRKNPESAWWASRISERNTAVSPLFEDVCRLDVVKNLLQSSERPALIIADNIALVRTLRQADWLNGRQQLRLRLRHLTGRMTVGFIKRTLLASKLIIPALLVFRTYQLIMQAAGAQLAGCRNLPRNQSNVVLLHTYLEETSFNSDYIFRDRYFPGLENFLKNNGLKILTLPVMFNLKRSFWSAWSWTKSCTTTHFVNPFSLYRLADYIFALYTAYRTSRLPMGSLEFLGNDLSALIKAERNRTSFDSLLQILYLRLPLRLGQQGVNCLALIAEFENMIPEKMLILGFNEHQPYTELIGFQHGALYPHLLCNFTPSAERGIAPMYNRVVCNGSRFRDILVSEGLSPDIAVVGAALRYQHLWLQANSNHPRRENNARPIDVFVPLPLMIPAGVELLDKLISALESSVSLQVVLKAHPMSTIEKLLDVAGSLSLPPHFKITKESMSAILPRTRIIVGLSTCTMFEAVAAGVPVVRVNRESALDLDPLAYLGDFSPSVRTGAELLEEVTRLLALPPAERAVIYQRGRKILAESFHPSDQNGLSAFLPSKVPMQAITLR